jgi:hypothetical protein
VPLLCQSRDYSPHVVVDKWLTEHGHPAHLIRDLRRVSPWRQVLALFGASNSHSAKNIKQELSIVLKRIFYIPSVAQLRTLLVVLSFMAMALAGSAGCHWG